MNLAPLQRERLIFLLGPRYNPKYPWLFKVVAKQYPDFSDNMDRAYEILKELYWEALRAPEDMVNWRRNPYLKEKSIKRIFGKTAEERRENMAALRKE